MPSAPAHVALLVDVANLRAGLSAAATASAGAAPAADGPDGARWGAWAPADVARALARYAGQVGRVILARAYADWSRLGNVAREMSAARLSPVMVPASAQGEDRSHIQLAVDALQALFAGDEPEAFLLVTSDATLLPLVQALRADGSEVTVISCASAASDELRTEADVFLTVEEVLAGAQGAPVQARDRSEDEGEASPYPGPAFPSVRGGWAEGASRPARPGRAPHPTPVAGPEVEFGAYDWTPFVRLVDELEQRLPFVGVRYLVNKVLGPRNCGLDDPRLKRDLINRAVDEGLVALFEVGNVDDRRDPVTACRLERKNSVVVGILGGETPTPTVRETRDEGPRDDGDDGTDLDAPDAPEAPDLDDAD